MFRELVSLSKAKHIIRKAIRPKPFGVEEISLLATLDRVLAEDVTATLDIPPFNRSTVDGYAVSSEDTFGASEGKPTSLRICGTVNIGEPARMTIKSGAAAEIVTGAPIPNGADAVLMVEYADRSDDQITIRQAVAKDENVMKAGTDIKKREVVLKAGQLLGSREIGALAAVGLARLKVYSIPRVAVLSTGKELTKVGRKLPPGRIYDINAYSLSTAVKESGGIPILLGIFHDDEVQLKEALRQALTTSDIVVTSGGVSAGPSDILPKIIDSFGKPGLIISGIAIKPGKPACVALIDGKPVFSLPGHPASALLVFYLLVQPVIREMAGLITSKASIRARMTTRVFPSKGRRTFVMVKLRRNRRNQSLAEPVLAGLSGAITTLTKADGFIEIAEGIQFVDAGEKVTVQLF